MLRLCIVMLDVIFTGNKLFLKQLCIFELEQLACGKNFSRKDHLYRHKQDQHKELRKDNLKYVGDLYTLNVNRCAKVYKSQ